MAALATVADVEGVWRPLSTAEQGVAQNWLDRASSLIRVSVPGLDQRIALSPDLAAVAAGVAVDMVLRVLKNPDAKVEEGVDDYRYKRDASVSSGALYLAPGELASLLPVSGGIGGAYVVSLGG